MPNFSLSRSDEQHTLKLNFQEEKEILKIHSSAGIVTQTQSQKPLSCVRSGREPKLSRVLKETRKTSSSN